MIDPQVRKHPRIKALRLPLSVRRRRSAVSLAQKCPPLSHLTAIRIFSDTGGRISRLPVPNTMSAFPSVNALDKIVKHFLRRPSFSDLTRSAAPASVFLIFPQNRRNASSSASCMFLASGSTFRSSFLRRHQRDDGCKT